MWLTWWLPSQLNADCSFNSCASGLQTMAAYWRFSLWSCCPMDGPTWTRWAAADSGCSREATEMVTTQLTLNTWRTWRSGTRRATLRKRGSWKYHSNLSFRLCVSQVSGSELELLHRLHDSVYQQTQEWYQRLGNRIREQIDKQYGTMPDKEEDIQVCSTKFLLV